MDDEDWVAGNLRRMWGFAMSSTYEERIDQEKCRKSIPSVPDKSVLGMEARQDADHLS